MYLRLLRRKNLQTVYAGLWTACQIPETPKTMHPYEGKATQCQGTDQHQGWPLAGL